MLVMELKIELKELFSELPMLAKRLPNPDELLDDAEALADEFGANRLPIAEVLPTCLPVRFCSTLPEASMGIV